MRGTHHEAATLYEEDRRASLGLRVLPKQYEHLHLTSFSKMLVDLAAQVNFMCILISNVCKYAITTGVE